MLPFSICAASNNVGDLAVPKCDTVVLAKPLYYLVKVAVSSSLSFTLPVQRAELREVPSRPIQIQAACRKQQEGSLLQEAPA